MWLLALSTVISQSGTGLTLGLTAEPAPACFSPEYAHSRDLPEVILSDCLLLLAADLMDPILETVKQWPDAYTRKDIREQGGCNLGVIKSSGVTNPEARFSLLDQTIAAALIIRQCVERGPWRFGGIRSVGENKEFNVLVLNPANIISNYAWSVVQSSTSKSTLGNSSTSPTLSPQSHSLTPAFTSTFPNILGPDLGARLNCLDGPPPPEVQSINGTDCLFMFYQLLTDPRVKRPHTRSEKNPAMNRWSHGTCEMVLSGNSEASIDQIRMTEILVVAAQILHTCVMDRRPATRGGLALVGIRGMFFLTLAGSPVGRELAHANQTMVVAMGDGASR